MPLFPQIERDFGARRLHQPGAPVHPLDNAVFLQQLEVTANCRLRRARRGSQFLNGLGACLVKLPADGVQPV
jgi:hypothetical protein